MGRVKRKSGLQVINFNEHAAHLKYKPSVYEFYKAFSEPLCDLSCCRSEPELQCSSTSHSIHESEEEAVYTVRGTDIDVHNILISCYSANFKIEK